MTTGRKGPAFENPRRRRRQETAEQKEAAAPAVGPGVVDQELAEQVLRLAWDLGLNESGRQAPRGVKGKAKVGYWLWAETDEALREACKALGVRSISDMVDAAIREYLTRRGFQVAAPGSLEAERQRRLEAAAAALEAQSSAAGPDPGSAG